MFLFSYIHFTRMVKEIDNIIGDKIEGFYYDRVKRSGYLDFNRKKLYFDLTHPFVSFFVVESLDLPFDFERKYIDLDDFRLEKVKQIEDDRVVYLVLRKKNLIKIVTLELTGKASYFLVIDKEGRIVRKYPPHRKRLKRGDVGDEYVMPERRIKVNLKKYFPVIESLDKENLKREFLNDHVFYTDGKIVMPIEFENSKICGSFAECMFKVYRTMRAKSDTINLNNDVPYYVYYKAASMLEKGLIDIKDDNLTLDGYSIHIPPAVIKDTNTTIDYLYSLGRHMRKKVLKSDKYKDRGDVSRSKIISPSGYEVLVGRNAKDNNRITFNIARGNDTFFHVRDYPGAHVILRNNGQPVSKEDILFCSQLAKKFSKAGNDEVDIMYTLVKYVKPVRGNPGKVIILREKTVRV